LEEEELKKEQWENIGLEYEWLILEYEIKEASLCPIIKTNNCRDIIQKK
jgi:hypothetical protein